MCPRLREELNQSFIAVVINCFIVQIQKYVVYAPWPWETVVLKMRKWSSY